MKTVETVDHSNAYTKHFIEGTRDFTNKIETQVAHGGAPIMAGGG